MADLIASANCNKRDADKKASADNAIAESLKPTMP